MQIAGIERHQGAPHFVGPQGAAIIGGQADGERNAQQYQPGEPDGSFFVCFLRRSVFQTMSPRQTNQTGKYLYRASQSGLWLPDAAGTRSLHRSSAAAI